MSIITPTVGDVISSPEFAFGYKSHTSLFGVDTPVISVDGKTVSHIVGEYYDEEDRVAYAAKFGKILPKRYEVDYGAHDPSRGMAKFVVERAEMEGGSTGGGMSGHDDYPDEVHVTARRLSPTGKYDPNGEIIEFYFPKGCHSNSVDDLTIHGHMTRIFI